MVRYQHTSTNYCCWFTIRITQLLRLACICVGQTSHWFVCKISFMNRQINYPLNGQRASTGERLTFYWYSPDYAHTVFARLLILIRILARIKFKIKFQLNSLWAKLSESAIWPILNHQQRLGFLLETKLTFPRRWKFLQSGALLKRRTKNQYLIDKLKKRLIKFAGLTPGSLYRKTAILK